MGSNVTSIGVSALSGQSYLVHVDLPDSVSSIGASAFMDAGMPNVNIPNSVTSIGDYAFACTASNDYLKKVVFDGDAPATGLSIFSNVDPLSAEVYAHISASGFDVD